MRARRSTLAVSVLAPLTGFVAISASASPPTQCTGAFTGATTDLIVPAGMTCIVDNATITHDLVVNRDAQLAIENSTVGHDLVGNQAGNIESGFGGGNPGSVTIGHDLAIHGADTASTAMNDVAYDICDTTVNHDLSVTNTAPQFDIEIGDKGMQGDEFCTLSVSPPDTVGHDLSVISNSAGRIDVGDNTIGHDLNVIGNQTNTSNGNSGDIDVSDNHVGHDANCHGNNPTPAPDGPEDGPNSATGNNTCG